MRPQPSCSFECRIQQTFRLSCLLVEVGGVVVDDGGDLLLRHDSLADNLGEKKERDTFQGKCKALARQPKFAL